MKRKRGELLYDYKARREMLQEELRKKEKGAKIWDSINKGPAYNPKRMQKKINRRIKQKR